MHVVAIVSQKGGSGKTTTAINLAIAAHEAGKSVLIIDLDIQASAYSWFQARDSEEPPVLPTHHAALAQVLKGAESQGVELVLIDTAGKTEVDTREAVDVANLVLVPCRPSAMDLRAIMNTVRLCQGREKTPYIVLSQVEPQGTAATEARETLESLEVKVLETPIGRRAAFMHSINDGRGVCEYEPDGKAAQEVRELFALVMKLAKKQTRLLATTSKPKAKSRRTATA